MTILNLRYVPSLPFFAFLFVPPYPASEKTQITVEKGMVELSNENGKLLLKEGQTGYMIKNTSPALVKLTPNALFPNLNPPPNHERQEEKTTSSHPFSWALGITLERNKAHSWTIQYVNRGSPAQRAGLEKGDKIISMDGLVPKDLDEVKRIIQKSKPGTRILVKILRDGKERNFSPIVGDWAP